MFVIVPSPRESAELHKKVVSNIEEIRARGARVIAIAEEGDAAVMPHADEVLRIPLAGPLFEPLLAVVPLHIFAMGLATAKGLDVDQPRNLAKSVTVESAASGLRGETTASRQSPRTTRPRGSRSTEGFGHAMRAMPRDKVAGCIERTTMIVGIGVDLVDIARFERTLERTPRLLERLFSPAEQTRSPRSLAARYAAKEALIKALGGSDGVHWTEIEITPEASGRPWFTLTGSTAAVIAERGITGLHLSMSHDARLRDRVRRGGGGGGCRA